MDKNNLFTDKEIEIIQISSNRGRNNQRIGPGGSDFVKYPSLKKQHTFDNDVTFNRENTSIKHKNVMHSLSINRKPQIIET